MNRDALNALDQTIAIARERKRGPVAIVGVAGPQGSGKTTLVRAYVSAHPGAAHFSIDDVYLRKRDRQRLAREVHPLFATRGPPGTHDIELFNETLTVLESAQPDWQVALPAFDKVADDRVPGERWPVFRGRPDVILVDGWCVGAVAQDTEALDRPVNKLETNEDVAGTWRRRVNEQLGWDYRIAFARIDAILHLRAPAFDVVHEWRCQQEEGLLGRILTPADRDRIGHFIQHYERITRHMMDGGRRADVEVQLDARRNVTEVKRIGA